MFYGPPIDHSTPNIHTRSSILTTHIDSFKPTKDALTLTKQFIQLFGGSNSSRQSKENTDAEVIISHSSQATTSNFYLDYFNHGTKNKKLVLKVPIDITIEGKKEYHTTLVGHFMGKKLPSTLATSSLKKLWVKEGMVNTLATDSGFYFFNS